MAHSYAEPGTYTVTLTVTDQDGQSDTATTRVTVVNSPFTTVTDSRPLDSPVASTSKPGGTVDTALVLPAPASRVTDTSTVAGCGDAACAAAARRLVLGHVVKRHVKRGALVLKLRPSNHKLLSRIKAGLRRHHKHTLPATITIVVKLTTHKTVRIVQHIKLRF